MSPPDSTRVRDQPALTRSSGREWLIVGGAFTVVALAVLIPMAVMMLPPSGLPLTAAVVDVALYVAMVVVRVMVRRQRMRLGILAVLMLAIAALSLVAVIVVAWSAAGAVAG